MKRIFKVVLLLILFISLFALTGLYIGNHNVPVLDPKGFISIKQRDLLFNASLLMLIVVIPVFIMTLAFGWRYREKNEKATYRPDWGHNYAAEVLWWGVPLVIIVILSVMTWRTSHELNPVKPIIADKKSMVIQVVALEWKWLFIYPEQNIATLNYLKFPVDTPVEFEITADAPMNSFWIPQLGGQIYAMPAMRTRLNLMGTEVGSYRGSSANLSGNGFAGMFFQAHVVSDEDFSSWVSSVQGSGDSLTQSGYNRLVLPSYYDSKQSFILQEPNLFDAILEKYMKP